MAAPAAGAVPGSRVGALVAKVRDGAAVPNTAVTIAAGAGPYGARHVLGI